MYNQIRETTSTTRKILRVENCLNLYHVNKNGFPIYNIVHDIIDNSGSKNIKNYVEIRKLTNFKLENSNVDLMEFYGIEPELQLSILSDIYDTMLDDAKVFKCQQFTNSIVKKSVEKVLKFNFLIYRVEMDRIVNIPQDKWNFVEINESHLYSIDGADFGFSIMAYLKHFNTQNRSESEINEYFNEIKNKLSNENFTFQFKKFENIKIKAYIFPYNPFKNSTYFEELNLEGFINLVKMIKNKNYKNKDIFPYELRLFPMSLLNQSNSSTEWSMWTVNVKNTLAKMNRYLDDFLNTKRFDRYLNETEIQWVNFFKKEIKYLVDSFLVCLKTLLIDRRLRSSSNIMNLQSLIDVFDKKLSSFLEDSSFKQIINKMKDIDSYKHFNIEYLNKTLDGINCVKFIKNRTCLLCYSHELKENNFDVWKQCFEQFVYSMTINEFDYYVILNFDVCKPKRIDPTKIDILKFEDNILQTIQVLKNDDHKLRSNSQVKHELVSVLKHEPKRKINILLLGESGVGKSTFINAIHKYAKFQSLNEAKSSNSNENLIGSYFYYKNKKTNRMEMIETSGNKQNEIIATGQSTTQNAQLYNICIEDDCEINIIDTPGMGDTRGVAQDQKNFKQIIEYVSKLDHLNAICFLAKPNNARLTPSFRYCFKELFSYLNKQTIDNLIFCFTNTRETMFVPGDTYETLTTFIREIESSSNVKIIFDTDKNIFCFENESLRYLELIKHNTRLESDIVASYKDSWSISSENYRKLIAYVKTLKPFGGDQIANMSEWVQKYNQTLAKSTTDEILRLINAVIKYLNKKIPISDEKISKELIILDETICSKYELLFACAQLSINIKNQSLSIFNDNFDASMNELIKNLTYQTDSTSSHRLNDVIVKLLKKALEEYRKIAEKNGSIEITFQQLSQYFDKTN